MRNTDFNQRPESTTVCSNCAAEILVATLTLIKKELRTGRPRPGPTGEKVIVECPADSISFISVVAKVDEETSEEDDDDSEVVELEIVVGLELESSQHLDC